MSEAAGKRNWYLTKQYQRGIVAARKLLAYRQAPGTLITLEAAKELLTEEEYADYLELIRHVRDDNPETTPLTGDAPTSTDRR